MTNLKFTDLGLKETLVKAIDDLGFTTPSQIQIDSLLNDMGNIKNHSHIGIRNVNKRLKILYGEDSGLTISNPQDNLTVSEIKIKKSKLS